MYRVIGGGVAPLAASDAARSNVAETPSAELLAEVFPGVRLTRELGEHETLLAIGRAGDALGYIPRHSWRDHIG